MKADLTPRQRASRIIGLSARALRQARPRLRITGVVTGIRLTFLHPPVMLVIVPDSEAAFGTPEEIANRSLAGQPASRAVARMGQEENA